MGVNGHTVDMTEELAKRLSDGDWTMAYAVTKAEELVAYVKLAKDETITFAAALTICMQGQIVDALERHATDFWDCYQDKVKGR